MTSKACIGKYSPKSSAHPFHRLCASRALLSLLRVNGGGVHLVGDSSSGKSLAQLIAASVWGNPEIFAASWDLSKGGLEIEASSRNDIRLSLDEIKRADPRRVREMAYALANGQGKGTMTREREGATQTVLAAPGPLQRRALVVRTCCTAFGGTPSAIFPGSAAEQARGPQSSTRQISLAYSRMARSEENQPMRAVFSTAERHHSLGVLQRASTRRWASQ